jgi:hypothetical protein
LGSIGADADDGGVLVHGVASLVRVWGLDGEVLDSVCDSIGIVGFSDAPADCTRVASGLAPRLFEDSLAAFDGATDTDGVVSECGDGLLAPLPLMKNPFQREVLVPLCERECGLCVCG